MPDFELGSAIADKLSEFDKYIRLPVPEAEAVEKKLQIILAGDSNLSEKLNRIEQLVIKEQNATDKILYCEFMTLIAQNQQILNDNKIFISKLVDLQQKFEIIVREVEQLKHEREKKAALKEARAKGKKLSKSPLIPTDIYELLIQAVKGQHYRASRLRIAFCILAITGIRVNELLHLKVSQLKTLMQSSWIKIDCSKYGPSNHKAYLSLEGKRLLKARQKDFELLYQLKKDDSYIFTPEYNHNQMLRRESITRAINNVMRKVSSDLPNKPNFTSYSFRTGVFFFFLLDYGKIQMISSLCDK